MNEDPVLRFLDQEFPPEKFGRVTNYIPLSAGAKGRDGEVISKLRKILQGESSRKIIYVTELDNCYRIVEINPNLP